MKLKSKRYPKKNLLIIGGISIILFLILIWAYFSFAGNSDCTKEGKIHPSIDSCCSGLVRIFSVPYLPLESCEELGRRAKADGTLSYVCADCGNGNCENWENRCNCPRDCHFQ